MEIRVKALEFLFLIVVLVIFIYKHKKLKLEIYRSNLFAIRKELFMLGATKELDFDSNEYRFFENMINLNIRFAHRINFVMPYLGAKIAKANKIKIVSRQDMLEQVFSKIGEDKQKLLKQIDLKIIDATFSYLFQTSLIFMCFVLKDFVTLFLSFRKFDSIKKETKSEASKMKKKVIPEILNEEQIEEERFYRKKKFVAA